MSQEHGQGMNISAWKIIICLNKNRNMGKLNEKQNAASGIQKPNIKY